MSWYESLSFSPTLRCTTEVVNPANDLSLSSSSSEDESFAPSIDSDSDSEDKRMLSEGINEEEVLNNEYFNKFEEIHTDAAQLFSNAKLEDLKTRIGFDGTEQEGVLSQQN